ncbi:MAG TPA: hypothetical protein VH500_07040 [Nitrososphaeraceae archaeon]|jgi:hypothetical protein
MRKFVIAFSTIVVSIIAAIVVVSMVATSVVYAQNSMLQGADYNNSTNPTTLRKKLHANIIIDAIHAKIRSVYDGYGKKSTGL